MLKLDELIPAEATLEGEGLLGQACLEASCAHIRPDSSARLSPSMLTSELCVVAAGWHALMPR